EGQYLLQQCDGRDAGLDPRADRAPASQDRSDREEAGICGYGQRLVMAEPPLWMAPARLVAGPALRSFARARMTSPYCGRTLPPAAEQGRADARDTATEELKSR